MIDHTYKTVELTGTSSTTIEDAVNNALAKAANSIHSMRWFVLTETRGGIDKAKVAQWQVTLKVSFTLDNN